MALTQTQLADAVAEKAGLSRADAKKAITALEEVVVEQIGKAEKVKIGGIVQVEARLRPATQERQGRNPATGEEITISAKPASVAVKARPLAKASIGNTNRLGILVLATPSPFMNLPDVYGPWTFVSRPQTQKYGSFSSKKALASPRKSD